MIKITKIFFLLNTLLILFSFKPYCQQKKLEIGDKIPDVLLQNVINYCNADLRISDFNGKYIILDFWNQYCLSCIKAFPKIDSLQKKYASNIQFLLVNKESKSSTINFFKKKTLITKPDVPFVTADVLLGQLFPNEGYPYSVWIDKNFTICYITNGYNITTENLQAFINSQTLDIKNVSVKKIRASLFESEDKSIAKKIYYYSYISPCIEGIDVGYYERAKITDSTIKLSSNCSSIVELYKRAYRESDQKKYSLPGTIILRAKNSFKFQKPENTGFIDAWSKLYAYNYDLMLPLRLKQSAYKIMQEDLKRYFGLKVHVKRKKINGEKTDVLVLKE